MEGGEVLKVIKTAEGTWHTSLLWGLNFARWYPDFRNGPSTGAGTVYSKNYYVWL